MAILTLFSLLFFGITCHGALFGITCEDHPDQMSEWSKCVIPHGNLADQLSNFMRDVKNHGCKLPPKKAIRFGISFLRNHTSYMEHPLYRRIPSQNCGNCGRRVRCCKLASSFFAQGYESETCVGYSQACAIDPLTEQEIADLTDYYPQSKYPDAVQPTDGCDVSGYVKAELQIVSSGPAFKYVEPLLCQIIGTRLPSVNCMRQGNKCLCCCIAHKPTADGRCIPADSIDTAFTCQDRN